MQLTFTVRHGQAPDEVKRYFQDEVTGLAKFFERLVEADIVLDQEGHRHIAEVRIHTSTDTHFASSEDAAQRTAIDATISKLRRQLKRHKQKLNRRALTHEERERLFGGVGQGEPAETDPSVAPPEWDRISSREAITRLATSGEEVLVFVDTIDGTVKIARRDEEGSVSVVEAEAFEIEER